MVLVNKPGQVTLQASAMHTEPVRCSVNAAEMYEVRFETLACRDRAGNLTRMHVLRSVDGGNTWKPVRLKRNWRKQWREILVKGLGGMDWPPTWSDFKAAYVKDGVFAISYHSAYSEFGPKGQAYVWEMRYDPRIDRWDLASIEEIWPDKT